MERSNEVVGSMAPGPKYRYEFSREMCRFILAFILLGGFLGLIAIAMIGGYSDPLVLSGMFSGWIAAIIGFYFIQQNAEDAIDQAKRATDLSSSINAETIKTAAEIRSITDASCEQIKEIAGKGRTGLSSTAEKKDALIRDLLMELEKKIG